MEASNPSDELVAGLGPFGGVQDFDQTAGLNGGAANTQVAHTFTGLPDGIQGATLRLPIRAGDEEFVSTDGVILSFYKDTAVDYAEGTAWRRTFAAIAEDVNLFPSPDPGLFGTWSPADERVLELNLGALPLAGGGTVDLIPEMDAESFLDVVVSDETAVDFISLILNIPEPGTGMLVGAVMLGVGVAGRGITHRPQPKQPIGRVC